MKTIICAIARNEALYINDWIQYHLNLGFDEIHIFDNGNNGCIISDDKIKIYNYTNEHEKRLQLKAYNSFYQTASFDWCLFLDIDEFITIQSNDIHDFISSFDSSVSVVKIHEILYGDDDKIFPDDITVPVYERILKPAKVSYYMNHKMFVRKEKDMYIHCPEEVKNAKHNIVNPYGKIFTINDYKIGYKKIIVMPCYIRHYKTKTLSEFCNQKLNLPRVLCQTVNRTTKYYFSVNKETPEKLEYIKNLGYST